jgi:hypothetical protein
MQDVHCGGKLQIENSASRKLANGVQRIYTFNTADFTDFKELTVLEPSTEFATLDLFHALRPADRGDLPLPHGVLELNKDVNRRFRCYM